ncbi:hypothetical protein LEP1GSC021_0747 [Leptospira noguchii str. 1993005606]|nr:hypothetical protein LEP1GSC021_0747 [Leptospira noguchii str. 1993005606]
MWELTQTLVLQINSLNVGTTANTGFTIILKMWELTLSSSLLKSNLYPLNCRNSYF